MTADFVPLPKAAYKQDWREDEVNKVIWNQDDSETDDNEAVEKQWGIDAEGAHCLVGFNTDKDRDEHYAEQPCELGKQT